MSSSKTVPTHRVHIDQPRFLLTPLLYPHKPKLLIYLVINPHFLESLFKLRSFVVSLWCRIAWSSASSPAPPSSE